MNKGINKTIQGTVIIFSAKIMISLMNIDFEVREFLV